MMMKLDAGWNWFVTLSARDYPLVTQDGNANTVISVLDHGFALFIVIVCGLA